MQPPQIKIYVISNPNHLNHFKIKLVLLVFLSWITDDICGNINISTNWPALWIDSLGLIPDKLHTNHSSSFHLPKSSRVRVDPGDPTVFNENESTHFWVHPNHTPPDLIMEFYITTTPPTSSGAKQTCDQSVKELLSWKHFSALSRLMDWLMLYDALILFLLIVTWWLCAL